VRADRLVALALLLQARGQIAARDLATELEVSVRTVYRDISALNAAGIPVIAEPGRGGGCRLVDGYRFPLRGLSAGEAEALLILGVPRAVAELGLADALAAAHRKVSASAPTAVRTGAVRASGPPSAADEPPGGESPLVHLDMPRWFHGAEPAPHLRTLAGAVRAGRRVRLGYRRDGEVIAAKHVVGPLGLVNKAGTWYLVASAPPRPEPLVYRAGRITSAEVLADPAVRPGGFDLVAFWERWSAEFVSSRPKVEVRARLSSAALEALPYVFGDAGNDVARRAAPADERGFREATFTFEDERAAAQRLAGFGGEIEVLSPPEVRDRLIVIARQLLSRYVV